MNYEEKALKACKEWQQEMMKNRSTFLGKKAKVLQTKINNKIPEKVHRVVSESIRHMVQTVLSGSDITSKRAPMVNLSLKERDERYESKLTNYRRTASAEGAGTGLGGLWWGLADFPMLLGIKIKFLYDIAGIYGFDVRDFRERLFILFIFQTAFSSDQKRTDTFLQLRNWPDSVGSYQSLDEVDWQTFQQEYRDYIDLAKLLQLVPGLGAIVGAVANYRLLNHLGETAKMAYHMRLLDSD